MFWGVDRPGDSHTMALTELGFVWGWGTFRDSSGVLGFSPTQRIALVPTIVHKPAALEDQAVKIASGAKPFPGPLLIPELYSLVNCPDGVLSASRWEPRLFIGPIDQLESVCTK